MKLRLFSLVVLSVLVSGVLLSPSHSFGRVGGAVGNGGDILVCLKDKANPFEGYYVLDYVATYDYDNGNADIVKFKDPILEIEKHLLQKLPSLGRQYRAFMGDMRAQVFKKADFARQSIWRAKRMGLIDLDDEYLFEPPPQNCFNGGKDKAQMIQAVIREERPHSVMYYYNRKQMGELRRQSELQFSFMMIHEWLWHYSPNANVVRDANRYLHSEEFFASSTRQIKLVLRGIGVDIDVLPKRKRVEIETEECLPRLIPYQEIKADPDVGFDLVFENNSRCSLSVGYSPLKVYEEVWAGKKRIFKGILPPNVVKIMVSPRYCDRIGCNWDHLPKSDVIKVVVDHHEN